MIIKCCCLCYYSWWSELCPPLQMNMLMSQPSMSVFGERALMEVIKVNDIIRVAPSSNGIGVLIRRRGTRELSLSLPLRAYTEERSCEDICKPQKKTSPQKQTLWAPSSRTSCLQNCKKINIHCLSPQTVLFCSDNLSILYAFEGISYLSGQLKNVPLLLLIYMPVFKLKLFPRPKQNKDTASTNSDTFQEVVITLAAK